MKRRRVIYTKSEIAFVRDNKSLPRPTLHSIFVALFDRPDVTYEDIKSLCKKYGWRNGRDPHRFKKGWRNPNKGISRGCLDSDGYVVNHATGPGRVSRTVREHRRRWEELNGPIPNGMVLKTKGERSNPDPSNWEMVPVSMMNRLNGRVSGSVKYDDAPDELKPVIMATARLHQAAREASNRNASSTGRVDASITESKTAKPR